MMIMLVVDFLIEFIGKMFMLLHSRHYWTHKVKVTILPSFFVFRNLDMSAYVINKDQPCPIYDLIAVSVSNLLLGEKYWERF